MKLMSRNARLAGMDRALGTNLGDRYSIITLLCKLLHLQRTGKDS